MIVRISLVRGLLRRSHKKRKDSLETRAELAILRNYVQSQAILEPILLYRASKCKQTARQRGLIMDPYFTFL